MSDRNIVSSVARIAAPSCRYTSEAGWLRRLVVCAALMSAATALGQVRVTCGLELRRDSCRPDSVGWTAMQDVGAPESPRAFAVGATLGMSVWTGKRWIVSAGAAPRAYDPCSGRWSSPTVRERSRFALEGTPVRLRPEISYVSFPVDDLVLELPIATEEARHDQPAFHHFGGMRIALPTGRVVLAPKAGAPEARYLFAAAHVGRLLLVWGGERIVEGGRSRQPVADGAVLDLRTRRWRAIAQRGAPSARRNPFFAVIDGKLFVWGGSAEDGHLLGDGALYDPRHDRWTAISTANAPSPREWATHTGVAWSIGRYVLLDGGMSLNAVTTDDAIHLFDVRAGRWISVRCARPSLGWSRAFAISARQVLLVDGRELQRAAILDLDPGRVREVELPEPIRGRSGAQLGWTGARLLIWGGLQPNPTLRPCAATPGRKPRPGERIPSPAEPCTWNPAAVPKPVFSGVVWTPT